MSVRRFAALALVGAISLIALSGCAATSEEAVAQSEDGLTSYGELFTTLEGADLDRWYTLRSALITGFDRVCGDTICSGDYSNLATVSLTCSSTSAQRRMKDCTWVLGGSIDYVDGTTGQITSDARVFTCKIPVAGTAPTLLRALEAAGDDALHAPIPGTGKSFYDGLVGCFSGVMGGPPPAAPETTQYRDLGDWLVESADGAGWAQTTRNLVESFDQVCGDTFCEGEYPDITALRFVCSMKVDTQQVSHCSWSFAAADTWVGARGAITANVSTRRCDVAIDASAGDLAMALSCPDPLQAALPGQTTSIYDALIGCL
jgi:hypothetical protein